MIDTVHFKLHNLEANYHDLYRVLLNQNSKTAKTTYTANSPFSLLERTMTYMHNSGEAKERFSAIVHNSPSSHYKIVIGVDLRLDCINFNLSIPKYLYSSNYFQYVKHPQRDKDIFFFEGTTDQFEFHSKLLLKSLRRFFQIFFAKEFVGTKINNEDIELTRIDFCYNQIFQSKTQALEYLEIIKEFKKKYLRKDSKIAMPYATSIFYSNKDYSYKIYHKGTEFEKNDKKELEKLIKNKVGKGLDLPTLDVLQSSADCVLRYEMTFRNSYLSKVYHSKIFRSSVSKWQKYKKLNAKINYRIEKNKFEKNDDETFKLLLLLRSKYYESGSILNEINWFFNRGKEKSFFEKLPSDERSLQLLRKFNKQFNAINSSKKYFFMDLFPDDLILYREDKNTNHNFLTTFEFARVSQDLLSECWNIFMDHNKSFQPTQGSTYNDAIKKLHAYNDVNNKIKKYTKKPSIDVPTFSAFLLLLNQYPFDKICDILKFDKQTKYRYKQKLKLIGLDEKSIFVPLPYQPSLDLKEYFQEMTMYKYKYNAFFKIILDF